MRGYTKDVYRCADSFIRYTKKIVCTGVNYHPVHKTFAKQKPVDPYFFLKPSTTLVEEEDDIFIPSTYKDIKQETTLGVIIGTKCKFVEARRAMNYVMGYCVAQDLTGLDHLTARKNNLPWTIAKCFDTSCPVTRFIPYDSLRDPHNATLWCIVNGGPRQHANTRDMIHTIPELISLVSSCMTLEKYDLLLTGSPPHAGPLHPGDIIEFGVEDVVSAIFTVDAD